MKFITIISVGLAAGLNVQRPVSNEQYGKKETTQYGKPQKEPQRPAYQSNSYNNKVPPPKEPCDSPKYNGPNPKPVPAPTPQPSCVNNTFTCKNGSDVYLCSNNVLAFSFTCGADRPVCKLDTDPSTVFCNAA